MSSKKKAKADEAGREEALAKSENGDHAGAEQGKAGEGAGEPSAQEPELPKSEAKKSAEEKVWEVVTNVLLDNVPFEKGQKLHKDNELFDKLKELGFLKEQEG